MIYIRCFSQGQLVLSKKDLFRRFLTATAVTSIVFSQSNLPPKLSPPNQSRRLLLRNLRGAYFRKWNSGVLSHLVSKSLRRKCVLVPFSSNVKASEDETMKDLKSFLSILPTKDDVRLVRYPV
jgi:hypothetical protein